jgi:hypothetical protein
MEIIKRTQSIGAVAILITVSYVLAPALAQEPPINLSGVWWSGAPVPLLPGESPAMGMGMGGGSSTLMLTDYGQELMSTFDPADDPAVNCVQAGLVRQITSPYPLQIAQTADTVTIEYEEWEILRTIHLNEDVPANFEAIPLGYSTGHYEDATLIVNSTRATRGLARASGFFWTSEEVSSIERYSLTERGQLRMELDVTDPIMLAEPFHFEKIWNPYDEELLDFDCVLRER